MDLIEGFNPTRPIDIDSVMDDIRQLRIVKHPESGFYFVMGERLGQKYNQRSMFKRYFLSWSEFRAKAFEEIGPHPLARNPKSPEFPDVNRCYDFWMQNFFKPAFGKYSAMVTLEKLDVVGGVPLKQSR